MFRSWSKTRDIITLFHKPSTPSSLRVLNLLKQASASASEAATQDQAADHSRDSRVPRAEFDLDVTEAAPTSDQLRSILEYVGPKSVGNIVKGASDEGSALQMLKQNEDNFVRPLVVDWNNGRAVAGANESEILKMLKELPKAT